MLNYEKSDYLPYFDREVTQLIAEKYGFDLEKSLRLFIGSKTHELLADKTLEFWIYSPFVIFDMWEVEQIKGNPTDSLYIREVAHAD